MTVPPERTPRSRRTEEIVAAALELLEQEGLSALTMRRLGEALGIRAPSLYKHLPGKAAIQIALIEFGLWQMGTCTHRAIERRSARTATPTLLRAYREQALAHPNLYRLATAGPLPREALTPGLEEWAGEPWFSVTGDPNMAQALWSFAHGMVILEIDGRFPPASNLDRTWSAGAKAFAVTTPSG